MATILSFLIGVWGYIVTLIKLSFGVRKHMTKESHSGISQFVEVAKSKLSGAKANLNFWLAMLQNSPTTI